MIPVEVVGISVCPPYQGYVVILKEKEGERWLPIFIGAAEAQSISFLLQGLEYARPMTFRDDPHRGRSGSTISHGQ
jgi:bifunctional DNase/RNase